VVAQAQAFDRLGQRYDLFIHTGGDHLAFATEDRFGDVVSALGNPVRRTNSGSFTYDWYPSLDSSRLGIGATGDYWVDRISGRDAAFGKLASVGANDAALPADDPEADRCRRSGHRRGHREPAHGHDHGPQRRQHAADH